MEPRLNIKALTRGRTDYFTNFLADHKFSAACCLFTFFNSGQLFSYIISKLEVLRRNDVDNNQPYSYSLSQLIRNDVYTLQSLCSGAYCVKFVKICRVM